jgi:hypothetical protein
MGRQGEIRTKKTKKHQRGTMSQDRDLFGRTDESAYSFSAPVSGEGEGERKVRADHLHLQSSRRFSD